MVSSSNLFRLIGTIAIFINTAQQIATPSANGDALTNSTSLGFGEADQRPPKARPLYVIAHRVLTSKGIDDALKNGANAFEIDMSAHTQGWWADHDNTGSSERDSAEAIFHKIARERAAGKSITFVWLDIKNPDWCDPNDLAWRHCSVSNLRDLARGILQPAGVRVLYGYILGANSKTYSFIRDGLNSNEAINLDGNPKEALERFQKGGPENISRRVSSYGYSELPYEFGNCEEENYYTCTELRQAVGSGQFGKVFGWTSTIGQGEYVRKELEVADVDGIIYGYKRDDYYDAEETRSAANDILSWVGSHPDRRFVATNDNPPW
ncbi:MAG: hypothetical protein LQ342_001917 [Letrouitia transgressa]|nr:MAG: hypothetical protein LQ342_001917 [Letrouitia transgressa]